MTRVKPSRWASEKRRSGWATWRTSPPRPTSPKTARSGGSGRSTIDDAIARLSARSRPGSAMRTPPTAEAYTSVAAVGTSQWRASTASSIARRDWSTPCAVRRAGTPGGATEVSACNSTMSGRRPSSVGTTAEPGTCGLRSASKSWLGSATPTRPSPVISNTLSSFVDPNRCFTARTRRSE